MVSLTVEEIEFIKCYKQRCENEIIQVTDFKNDKEKTKYFPQSFFDKVDRRLYDLEFIYNIFDKLEKEVL